MIFDMLNNILDFVGKLFKPKKNWLDVAVEMEKHDKEEKEMQRKAEEEELKDEMAWTMVEGIKLDELDD